MPGSSIRTAVAALALLASAMADAAPEPDAERWQAMARADLKAVHDRIVAAHPGSIDTENPEFKVWVERGFEQANAYLPHVISYDTALAVVRYYTTGFEDGHLLYSDNIRDGFPVFVTGWHVIRRNGKYLVSATLPRWPGPLPPTGAEWTGCDGAPAQVVLDTRVAPFVERRRGEKYDGVRAGALWMQRPVSANLRECRFRMEKGEFRLPVSYHAIDSDTFFDVLVRDRGEPSRPENAFEVRDGVLWLRAGNFNLRPGSSELEALDAMLTALAEVRGARAIVFDARGNRGGDSGIGDRIFEAATGGLDYDRDELDSLPRYYAQWRVSDFLVGYLDSTIEQTKSLHGADSRRVAKDVEFRNEVADALARKQAWVEQDAGRSLTRQDIVARNGRLRRFEGGIALLTDDGCVSACLDFADVVLQVPGSLHVGQTTGADSVYMVGSRSRMPSGNLLVMPVKVWRNRTRGNNQPYVPDVRIDLGSDEAAIRQSVLRALAAD